MPTPSHNSKLPSWAYPWRPGRNRARNLRQDAGLAGNICRLPADRGGGCEIVADAVRFSGLELKVAACRKVSDAGFVCGKVDVFDLQRLPLAELRHKQVTAGQGGASFDYVAKVIELALAGEIDATVTGPINKAAINAAGRHYAGHTKSTPS